MKLKRSVLGLLPVLAVFLASPLYAEDMPELDDYTPPAQLFDAKPVKTEKIQEPSEEPFLTTIAPADKASQPPTPPRKPKAPVVPKKKSADKTEKLKKSKPVVAVAKPPASPTLRPVANSSKTQLENGRLVNPNARDVLASIEGVESPQKTGKGAFLLSFLPGETILTLDMKNKLLNDYIPTLKNSQAHLAIRAYARRSVSQNESVARRISLARALETRDFLVAAGIDEARISIMPLGDSKSDLEADRVEIRTTAP